MSGALRKVCLAGPLRSGKSTLWRELTGMPAKSHGFSVGQFLGHPGIGLWDSHGGCALDSLGQVFLGGAETVLVTVAADMRDGGMEARRIAAAVRALNPTARLGFVLTRADLGIGLDIDELAELGPVFPIIRGRGPGLAAMLRFATNQSLVGEVRDVA
jgi:hypothetical protein